MTQSTQRTLPASFVLPSVVVRSLSEHWAGSTVLWIAQYWESLVLNQFHFFDYIAAKSICT